MTSRAEYHRRLADAARALGWSLEPSRGGHMRLTKPGRPPVFASSTPGCHRALENALANLRRADRRQRWRGA